MALNLDETLQRRRNNVLAIHDLLKKIQVAKGSVIDEALNAKLWKGAQDWEQKVYLNYGGHLSGEYYNEIKSKEQKLRAILADVLRSVPSVGGPPPLHNSSAPLTSAPGYSTNRVASNTAAYRTAQAADRNAAPAYNGVNAALINDSYDNSYDLENAEPLPFRREMHHVAPVAPTRADPSHSRYGNYNDRPLAPSSERVTPAQTRPVVARGHAPVAELSRGRHSISTHAMTSHATHSVQAQPQAPGAYQQQIRQSQQTMNQRPLQAPQSRTTQQVVPSERSVYSSTAARVTHPAHQRPMDPAQQVQPRNKATQQSQLTANQPVTRPSVSNVAGPVVNDQERQNYFALLNKLKQEYVPLIKTLKERLMKLGETLPRTDPKYEQSRRYHETLLKCEKALLSNQMHPNGVKHIESVLVPALKNVVRPELMRRQRANANASNPDSTPAGTVQRPEIQPKVGISSNNVTAQAQPVASLRQAETRPQANLGRTGSGSRGRPDERVQAPHRVVQQTTQPSIPANGITATTTVNSRNEGVPVRVPPKRKRSEQSLDSQKGQGLMKSDGPKKIRSAVRSKPVAQAHEIIDIAAEDSDNEQPIDVPNSVQRKAEANKTVPPDTTKEVKKPSVQKSLAPNTTVPNTEKESVNQQKSNHPGTTASNVKKQPQIRVDKNKPVGKAAGKKNPEKKATSGTVITRTEGTIETSKDRASVDGLQYDSPSSTASSAGINQVLEEKANVELVGLDPISPATPFSPPINGTIVQDTTFIDFLESSCSDGSKLGWDLASQICCEVTMP